MGASVAGLVAAAMAQQVEQHDPVAAGGQPAGQAAAEVGVEQQAVQPHEHPVARAVDLVGQPVLTIGKRVPRAFRAAGAPLPEPVSGAEAARASMSLVAIRL